VDLAELLALQLSAAALEGAAQDRTIEFVGYHEDTQHLSHAEQVSLTREVEHVMNNRIILKLKGN
jgi:hypothetical protein